MIVCHCTGATDRDIRHAVGHEPSGAPAGLCVSPAGQCCGGCASKVREIIASAQGKSQANEQQRAARD
jgi:bacterioferritin-associated ferredoxin